MSAITDLYRRSAASRSVAWRLGRLAVAIALVVAIRNELFWYFVLTLLLVDSYVRRAIREGRGLGGVDLPPERSGRDTLIGFVVGALHLCAGIGVMAALGWYRITEVNADTELPGRFLYALVFFALVAIVEEILSRGMLFRWLERKAGTWIALTVSAFAFGLLHSSNPNATLYEGVALSVEAGVLLAALYMATRSLWVPIGAHWSWNLFEGPIFGTPVSGQGFDVLTESTTRGPEIWTGGAFGPEGGLVMVLLGVAVGIALIVVAIKRGNVRHRGEWFGGTQPTLVKALPAEP